MQKIRVYITEISGHNGSCAHKDISDVILELEETIEEILPNETFTITVDEMEQSEFDNLPDFEGY